MPQNRERIKRLRFIRSLSFFENAVFLTGMISQRPAYLAGIQDHFRIEYLFNPAHKLHVGLAD